MKGKIAVSLHGYLWAFEYDSGCTKLAAMDQADRMIRGNPDAELVISEWTESAEVNF